MSGGKITDKSIVFFSMSVIPNEDYEGTGEMAPSIKCLLCKHKDMSLDRQYPSEKLSVIVHAWDPSTVDLWPELRGLTDQPAT